MLLCINTVYDLFVDAIENSNIGSVTVAWVITIENEPGIFPLISAVEG